jgi:Asp-tRNA(Asn)/Glu-tRNA(Gln) amidotransferase A subunit family amidase
VKACLARISEREPLVSAWAHLGAEAALDEARLRDATRPLGALHGVPVAVKDVIDVKGMPTGMGSPIYEGFQPAADASCVSLLRAAGAVIIGKTVTAEFAGIKSGPTRNPHCLTKTPGGSSSGSAAAVADNMVPVAFGTQTGGSILRPASYCGVVGFKPSFNSINRAGLKFAAESFDTIGHLCRTVEDAALFWRVLVGKAEQPLDVASRPPRVALFRSHHWARAKDETLKAISSTVSRLEKLGCVVPEIVVPEGFDGLSSVRKTINDYERARALSWEWQAYRSQISDQLAAVIANGLSLSYDQYLQGKMEVARWRGWFNEATADYDAVLTPVVDGEAPDGLEFTGSSAFQETWTMFHVPAISLPLCQGPNGLPVGIQLVGKLNHDERLLAIAHWLMNATLEAQALKSTTCNTRKQA